MARYINADAVVKNLDCGNLDASFSERDIVDMIESRPTADVREVVHGEWVSSRPDAPMFGFHYCSICGRRRTSPQDNFCPNCGADMRGGNDGN